MAVEEKFNRKLLVEGNDDLHVVLALCKKFEVKENFNVIDGKGFDNIIKRLPQDLKESELKVLAVIVDADTSLQNRYDSIKTAIHKYKSDYSFPQEFPFGGLILQQDDLVKIGIWIMPDNKAHGMLEDFAAYLISEKDKLKPHVERILSEIEKEGLNKYSTVHKSKAFIHTWLAWQEDPGTPMGSAITKKFLESDNEKVSLFIKWMKNLFEDESD